MKKFFISLLLLTSEIHAGTISFIGPCHHTPLFTRDFEIDQAPHSVGTLTVKTLLKHSIPHIGTEQGINSIFNTPTGMDALEIISDSEMLAYGWCYSVNGFEPNLFPNEIFIKEDDDILWWFGYAHYKDGEWVSQCTPAFQRKPVQFCEEVED